MVVVEVESVFGFVDEVGHFQFLCFGWWFCVRFGSSGWMDGFILSRGGGEDDVD